MCRGISLWKEFMKISITKFLLIKACNFSEHKITVQYFSEFIFISTDDQDRQKNFVTKCLIWDIFELVVSWKFILIQFFRVCQELPSLNVVLNNQKQINSIIMQNLRNWRVDFRQFMIILLYCIWSLCDFRTNTIQLFQMRNFLLQLSPKLFVEPCRYQHCLFA